MKNSKIPSINFHLWAPCNMQCKFCFAIFADVKRDMKLPKGHLPKSECLLLIDRISDFGFEKINFAGGEPTLCSFLPELVAHAKKCGMVTSLVSNGSRITDEWLGNLNGSLNWIGLSIDTVDPKKQKRMGRAIRGVRPISAEAYLQIIRTIKQHNIRLKINTVVSSLTWKEDFTKFISVAQPERWKILQVLTVSGQNDKYVDDFIITTEQFEAYVYRHRAVESYGTCVIPESNEAMVESYAMIDPAGRFFDNAQGFHRYSDPILKVGVDKALKQVSMNTERFYKRGGKYDW